MVDIARPDSVIKKKKMKRAAYGVAGLTAILLVTVFVSQLKPAAPSVDKATLWPDVVKRGPMVRQVRGTGTLVPEDTRWIPATTAGRVERILLRSGADVMPDTVIVELGSPELEQTVVESRLQLESAVAQLVNRRAELDSALLTQRAAAANIESEARQAQMQAEADEALFKEGLQGALIAKKSRARADDLANRTEIELRRLDLAEKTLKSQLAVQEAEVSRLRTTYQLRQEQLEKLKVRAGIKGKLQVVPVEVGSQLAAGANVARVADPGAPQGRTAHPGNPDPGHRDRPAGRNRHAERRRPRTRLTHRRRRHQRNGHRRRPTDGRAPTGGEARPDGGRHGGARTPRQRGERRPRRVRPGEQHDVALQGRGRVPRSRRWTARRPAPR